MSTSTNYYQRSIDLSIFQGIKENGIATVDQSLFNNGGEVCTGIQKLIQRWLIRFLTPLGAVKFHPEWGTDFLSEAPSFHSELDTEIAFYSAITDVSDQLSEEEDDNMSDDEKLEKVDLLGITVRDTGFVMKIKITSQAGESAPLILPITINPLQL